MKYPKEVNILGIPYKIIYLNNSVDVDNKKRESLWGQIDFWDHVIRIYDNGRPIEAVWQTILHEILHGIVEHLKLKNFGGEQGHDKLDLIALGLTEILFRNKWIKE